MEIICSYVVKSHRHLLVFVETKVSPIIREANIFKISLPHSALEPQRKYRDNLGDCPDRPS